MPWFLMLQIYLIYCISELSPALRKKENVSVFLRAATQFYQNHSAALTTLHHLCRMIGRFFFFLNSNLRAQTEIKQIQLFQDSYFNLGNAADKIKH